MTSAATSDDEIRAETLTLLGSYQTLLVGRKFDEWIELWAEDGVCEFPYALESRPRRLEGKAQILEYMTSYPQEITIDGIEDLKVHPMLDPRSVAAELAIKGTATQTGRAYNQRYVIVARTDAGKIVEYREYWNPLISIDALGDREHSEAPNGDANQ